MEKEEQEKGFHTFSSASFNVGEMTPLYSDRLNGLQGKLI
jgi:hypothetical protein